MAPKVHKMGRGGPDPGNGAAGPGTLLDKRLREGYFRAKMNFPYFSLLDPKMHNITQSGFYLQKCENQYFSLLEQDYTKIPKESLGICRVGALGPQNAFWAQNRNIVISVQKCDFLQKGGL